MTGGASGGVGLVKHAIILVSNRLKQQINGGGDRLGVWRLTIIDVAIRPNALEISVELTQEPSNAPPRTPRRGLAHHFDLYRQSLLTADILAPRSHQVQYYIQSAD